MQLKENVNLLEFLQHVKHCKCDILFTTTDGDLLNLKSELSRYIFATIAGKEDFLLKGRITCSNEEDEQVLKNFLTTDTYEKERSYVFTNR